MNRVSHLIVETVHSSKVKLFNLTRPLSGLNRRPRLPKPTSFAGINARTDKMGLHHLMIGTWTPPGAIFTVQFDDEKLELKLIKRTEIPQDEPISWMTFDVSSHLNWLAILSRQTSIKGLGQD